MGRFAVGLVLGLLASAPAALSQQQPEQIDVGMTLQVGMAKNIVIGQLTAKGYRLIQAQKAETEIYVVDKKNTGTDYETLGELFFRNSRLTRATRTWSSVNDAGSAKLARNLYFLVKSFEGSGNASCTLQGKTQRRS
jgi:hypothetical protein